MGDAASVERVNILVDIVISVVLKRLNSDLETVVDVWCVRPCASSAWRLWSVHRGLGWALPLASFTDMFQDRRTELKQ